MRSKARGLAQHVGPPGWLEESDPAGVILYAIDGPYRPPFPYRIPVALTWAAQLRADGFSSCCYIVNVHSHPSRATSGKEGMAWYSSRPMPAFSLIRTMSNYPQQLAAHLPMAIYVHLNFIYVALLEKFRSLINIAVQHDCWRIFTIFVRESKDMPGYIHLL